MLPVDSMMGRRRTAPAETTFPRHGGLPERRRLAHDPAKCERFADKIMR